MDGPNVNGSFYKNLMAAVHETNGKRLVDIGSCGLQVVHNAFKAGFEATTWDLRSFLCTLHQNFHESPARMEDFTRITGSQIFPLKFSPHCRVENARVAIRALLVLGNVNEYVDTSFASRKVSQCGAKTHKVKLDVGNYGTLKVRYNCRKGHVCTWYSQPLLNGMAAGNLLLACAILYTGLTYERVREFADVLHMPYNARVISTRFREIICSLLYIPCTADTRTQ